MKYMIPLLAVFMLPHIADARRFENNSGRTVYNIVRALPDEIKDDFHEKTKTRHESWHKEMKIVHKEMRKMTGDLARLLKQDKIDPKQVDNILERMQSTMVAPGVRAMSDMRIALTETISAADLETRQEMAEELEEVFEEWEEYKPRRSRWWQFWRR